MHITCITDVIPYNKLYYYTIYYVSSLKCKIKYSRENQNPKSIGELLHKNQIEHAMVTR